MRSRHGEGLLSFPRAEAGSGEGRPVSLIGHLPLALAATGKEVEGSARSACVLSPPRYRMGRGGGWRGSRCGPRRPVARLPGSCCGR